MRQINFETPSEEVTYDKLVLLRTKEVSFFKLDVTPLKAVRSSSSDCNLQ